MLPSPRDPKAEAAHAAIDQAHKLLREKPDLNKNVEFMKRLEELEAAYAAYLGARLGTVASPTALGSVQAGLNPIGALLALLLGAIAAIALQTSTTNTAKQKQTLENLNGALRRLGDVLGKLKTAAQAGAATAVSAKLMSELTQLLELPGNLTPMTDRTRDMIRLAIAKLLSKYPNKCPDLEKDYKTKLTRWGGGAYGPTNMVAVWDNFIQAAVSLVKCLLKKTGGGPPGIPTLG